MKRLILLGTSLLFVALLAPETITAASAAATPECSSSSVLVSTGKWVGNPSTAETMFDSARIWLSTPSATCELEGTLSVAPLKETTHASDGATQFEVVARPAQIAIKPHVIGDGKRYGFYLNIDVPIGSSAATKKWVKDCVPANESFLQISDTRRGTVNWSIDVRHHLFDICTSKALTDLHLEAIPIS